jgi:hypothetical protein
MPPLHLADLALSAARRAGEDPSAQARRLYDRPDAMPLSEPVDRVESLRAGVMLHRVVDALRAVVARPHAADAREADTT